jgi:hypothetical protein
LKLAAEELKNTELNKQRMKEPASDSIKNEPEKQKVFELTTRNEKLESLLNSLNIQLNKSKEKARKELQETKDKLRKEIKSWRKDLGEETK